MDFSMEEWLEEILLKSLTKRNFRNNFWKNCNDISRDTPVQILKTKILDESLKKFLKNPCRKFKEIS